MDPRTPRPIPLLLGISLTAATLVGCTASGAPERSRSPSATAEQVAGDRLTGDAELIEQMAPRFADEFDRAAMALIDRDEVRSAFVAADATTVFELGAITKVLGGELLAIGIERGEVAADDPLGAHLDLGDAPAASVTLERLATHHGGLPYLPTVPAWRAEVDAAHDAFRNPLDDDLEGLLELARGLEARPGGGYEYSEIGSALLGHALAAAAGTSYAELVEARLFDPLGMDDATVVETPGQVPEGHAGGFTWAGDPVEPWSVGAFAPALGVDATLGDLVALARGVLDGPLAASPALEPIAETEEAAWRIGYDWVTVELPERTETGHSGETGGFSCSLLIDRQAGTAAIVLSNTTENRLGAARQLLRIADD